MKSSVNLYKLGLTPYNIALQLQHICATSTSNSLIIVEHPPVYTVGIRSKQYNRQYVDSLHEILRRNNLEAEFVETNRGGLITFHGPGQLVAYPILSLGDFSAQVPNKSIRRYVGKLESTIIDTLNKLGINNANTVKEYPGVWLDNGERKIAFIGVSFRRWKTMHGFSINCNCNLSWFDHIVSCGIEGKAITSIEQELSTHSSQRGKTTVDYVTDVLCQSFADNFNCSLVDSSIHQLQIVQDTQ